MNKIFNTTGVCIPERHYMVDVTRILRSIREMIDAGDYFVINRARQFGKTTVLRSLTQAIKQDYIVFPISLEGIGEAVYRDEFTFCHGLCRLMDAAVKYGETEGLTPESARLLRSISRGEEGDIDFLEFSEIISDICRTEDKPVILMIDEVDQASGQRVFLDFLGMLRNKYLKRAERPSFQSVILAGVHDIKNLKLKIRSGEEHRYNSPWNVAADFNIDMSFCSEDIASMLEEYESDWNTDMNIEEMSQKIYEYTSGYPYLVSKLCQLLDEQISQLKDFKDKYEVWSDAGFQEAVKLLLKTPNTLFDDMVKKLADYPKLKTMIQNILFMGRRYSYESESYLIQLGIMFGFLKEKDGLVCIANRIFEMKLYNLFLSEEETGSEIYRVVSMEQNQFLAGGMLQMDLVMKKFLEYYEEIYADADDKFIEDNGRRIFLMYLKTIINGTGNYYIEARTRDMKRTDIIVDYKGEQIIIEMKIWHGNEYNRRGEAQLFEYLNFYHKDKGYLLSFNFNKKKKCGIQEIVYRGKTIVEVVV